MLFLGIERILHTNATRQGRNEDQTLHAGPFKNTLLQHLPPQVIERLHLRPIALELKRDLEIPGQAIKHIYFIEEGIGSMTTLFEDGTQVEVSMFGSESAIGISALMGTRHSLNRVFMQLAGHGFTSPVSAAAAEFEKHGRFHALALRYVQAQLTQSTQNAACNARHTHEQRLARWLLICCDRAKQNKLEMAQEFVSEMLGSTRSTVSIAASGFKAKGLVEYSRGHIRILDEKGLEAEACECYRVVRDHLENLAEFDTGFVV